jgi:proline-specific peptidase
MERTERLVDIGDTALFVVTVGDGSAYPIVVLHGGPGIDHHELGTYLDPLADRGYRLLLVDQRGSGRSAPSDPSTWTLERMAADIGALADALGLARFAVLGHSYGAFVALQHAVEHPGQAAQTIVSGGLPSSRFLDRVEANLASFEPEHLRDQVASSWAREPEVRTAEDFASLMHDQWPFHFADPEDPRIEEYERQVAGTVYSPEILRVFSASGYGGIEVEDRLHEIPRPVLVLAGRHDRTCVAEASELMAERIPNAKLVVFERSGHMMFLEEQGAFLDAVDSFLRRNGAS